VARSGRVRPAEDPDTLTAQSTLVGVYRDLGRLDEAHRLATTDPAAAGTGQRSPAHRRPAGPQRRGHGALRRRRYREAVIEFEENQADLAATVGEDSPDTIMAVNNIAYCYLALGRPGTAIEIAEPAVFDADRSLGATNPATISLRHNLALAYKSTGRLTEAIGLYIRNLDDFRQLGGHDHPSVLTTRVNLAAAYQAAGRTAAAVELTEQVVADAERTLGADHPTTLLTHNNLAHLYLTSGRRLTAIREYRRALARTVKVLGPVHPDSRRLRYNLKLALGRRPLRWLRALAANLTPRRGRSA